MADGARGRAPLVRGGEAVGGRGGGAFTYFTTCIEGRAGGVNDRLALNVGKIGADNL